MNVPTHSHSNSGCQITVNTAYGYLEVIMLNRCVICGEPRDLSRGNPHHSPEDIFASTTLSAVRPSSGNIYPKWGFYRGNTEHIHIFMRNHHWISTMIIAEKTADCWLLRKVNPPRTPTVHDVIAYNYVEYASGTSKVLPLDTSAEDVLSLMLAAKL